jgi:superfamily II DNA/RNA helicase
MALAGHDLIGQAKTGTGKTLGFGVPLLQLIPPEPRSATGDGSPAASNRRGPIALVVVPTRELCIQVAADLQAAGKYTGARVLAIYGGKAYEPQTDALKLGVDIVVGTPGRLIDLLRQGILQLTQVQALVLDESDEMLDMGFLPDVERIIAKLPAKRQTMLFSATMPTEILTLARRYLTTPTHIRAAIPGDDGATVEAIEQHVWRVHPLNKIELVSRILQADGRGRVIIFCRTKRRAQSVSDELQERGFSAGTVHGDLGQAAREQSLGDFRRGSINVLVATDVAARGIDIDGVTHVVNHECPDDEKTYLHRIGRTGRAGATGIAVTFVDWEDVARWGSINGILGLAFADPIETYHTSEHIFTGLGIPTDATGIQPGSSTNQRRPKSRDEAPRGKASRTPPKASHAPPPKPPKKSRSRQRTRRGEAVAPTAPSR